MWVLTILSVALPALGALYWAWYRRSLDDRRRLDRPSGTAVFLASLACGGIVLFALVILLVLEALTHAPYFQGDR